MTHIANDESLSEINVTPFIDVMLVLLIIFMVVTPMLTSSIVIELPNSSSQNKDTNKEVIIAISTQEIAINSIKMERGFDKEILTQITSGDTEPMLYFYIDKQVSYERVMEVLREVQELGYGKISLSLQMK